MRPVDPSALLSAALSGFFLLALFLMGRAWDSRKARQEKSDTAEGLYIGGIEGMLRRNDAQLLEMKEQVTKAQKAAHEAQSEVGKAQEAAGRALETATREQVMREESDRIRNELRRQFDEAVAKIETLQAQVLTLQAQVQQLQQENAGLIGGAIGLNQSMLAPPQGPQTTKTTVTVTETEEE